MLQEPTAPSGLFAEALASSARAELAPVKVLLLGDPQPMFRSAASAITAFRGLSIAGGFRSCAELARYLESPEAGWQYAFVDFAARTTIATQFVQALLGHQQATPGCVVVFGDPEWPAMVNACASIGVHHVLKRGDVGALQGFLEDEGFQRQLS